MCRCTTFTCSDPASRPALVFVTIIQIAGPMKWSGDEPDRREDVAAIVLGPIGSTGEGRPS